MPSCVHGAAAKVHEARVLLRPEGVYLKHAGSPGRPPADASLRAYTYEPPSLNEDRYIYMMIEYVYILCNIRVGRWPANHTFVQAGLPAMQHII